MSQIAECPECSKKYKVPHLDKAWQCKACAVPLILPDAEELGEDEAPQAASSPPKVKGITCPKCGAGIEQRGGKCKECGESDPYASPAHSGRPKLKRAAAGSKQSMEESAARGAAKKELRKLGLLRFWTKLSLIIWSAMFVMAALGFSKSDQFLLPIAFLLVNAAIVWFLWSTHKALSTVYGRPRPFVIVLACLYTVEAVAELQDGLPVLGVLWAAIYWMFVSTLKRIEEIKEDNPGAFTEPDQAHSIAVDEKLHRRRLAESKRKAKELNRRLVIFGGIAAVILIGVVGYQAMNKPDSPDKIVADFQSAWNDGDFAAIGALATPGNEDRWKGKLEKRDRKLGWNGKPPALEAGAISPTGDTSIRVRYSTKGGSMGARFSLNGKKWVLKTLDYRELP